MELKTKEAQVQEQELNATIKKKADAELYQRQKEAEAKKFELEREAEAQMYQRQKEAEGIRMVGQAEADAIREKGLAEAEAMEKRALAYQKYNSAAMGEMLIKVLPELAEKIAQPLAAIDKVTIIGGDNQGVSNVADGVPAVLGKLFESVKETTGIDLSDIVRADGYDAKVTRNLNISGSIPQDMEKGIIAASATQTISQQENNGQAEEKKTEQKKVGGTFHPGASRLPLYTSSAIKHLFQYLLLIGRRPARRRPRRPRVLPGVLKGEKKVFIFILKGFIGRRISAIGAFALVVTVFLTQRQKLPHRQRTAGLFCQPAKRLHRLPASAGGKELAPKDGIGLCQGAKTRQSLTGGVHGRKRLLNFQLLIRPVSYPRI